MFQSHNIVMMHGFKTDCAVLFFKEALLNDELHPLVRQTANPQTARQRHFTHAVQINAQTHIIDNHIETATAAGKA